MKRILKYDFLFWILSSAYLFLFVLPFSLGVLVKIIIGYLFYFLVKEIFYQYGESIFNIRHRISVLTHRISNSPHKKTFFIHNGTTHPEKKKDYEDVSKFL